MTNPAPIAAPAVSVVVPTYGRPGELLRLLDSIADMDKPPPFEVIVADDASPDNTAAEVEGWRARNPGVPLHYLRLEKNRGPAAARNAGLRRASAPLVVFTDSDCIVDRAWLRMLVRKMDPANRIGGVGGRVLPLNPFGLVSRWSTLSRVLEPPKSLLYLVTCNCCYLREELLAVGGFDEEVRTPGGEDVAASIRLWDRGWRFAYDEDAVVIHEYRENLRNFCRTWYNYGFGCGYTTSKWIPTITHEIDPARELDWKTNPVDPEPWWVELRRQIVGGFQIARRQPGLLRQEIVFVFLKFLNSYSLHLGWRDGRRAWAERKGSASA